eukprot:g8455.t1
MFSKCILSAFIVTTVFSFGFADEKPPAATKSDVGKTATKKSTPLDAAREHLQKGRVAEAIEAYEALPKTADAVKVAIGLSRCYEATGEWQKATEVIAAAIKVSGRNADLHARSAQIQFHRGRYKEAESSAAKAIRYDGQHPLAHLVLADIYNETGRIKKAAEGYRWFVRYYNRKQPTDAETLLLVAHGALQYARWNRVSNIFGFVMNTLCPDALKDDKLSWQASHISGDLLLEKYNRGQAIPEYDAALAINPRAVPVLVSLGHAALMKHDLDKADEFADKALKVNGQHVPALQLKADVAISRGKISVAEAIIKRALAVNPHEQRSLARLAACYLIADGPPAEKTLDDLLANIDAISQFSAKDESRFVKLVVELAKRNPRPGYFLTDLGEAVDGRRQYPVAERFYKTAIRVMPELAQPQTSLGMLYMRVGKTKEASKLLDAAFKADPYHVRVSNMRKVLKLLDGYESITTEHFIIRVDSKADKILGKYMAEYLEEIYPELVKQFEFEPPSRTKFEIYHNAKGLKAHEWFSARMVGLPWIQTIGASTGMIVALASPTAVEKPFNWARVLKHEFVHIITLQQTKFNIPHWYTEALAVTAEGYPRTETWNRLLLERVPKGDLRTLKNLNDGFIRPKSPLDWQFAYCQSRLYAQYMIEKYGKKSIPKLLDAYRKNLPTEKAIPEATGVDLATFEKGYLDFLNKLVAGLNAGKAAEEKTPAELKQAYEADMENTAAAAAYANALFDANERKLARELATKALTKNAKEPLAALVMAKIAMLTEDAETALKVLTPALDRKSPNRDVLVYLVQLKVRDDKYGEAADLLELGKKSFPYDQAIQKALVTVYIKLDETAKLKPMLVDLAQRNFDDASIRKKLAEMAIKSKDFKSAVKYGREVLHIDVLDVENHILLGEAYRELKNFKKSADEFAVALELKPEDVAAKLGLAKTHIAAGDKEAAKKLLDAVLAKDAENAGVVGDGDHAVDGLHAFRCQFVAQRKILDAVFKQKRVAAGRQPVQAGGDGQRAGVTVVAGACSDFFDAGANVGGVGEAAARQIDLVDVERVPVDQRAKRLAAAFSFPRGDRYRRAIAQPGIAIDVGLTQRFFEPADVVIGKRVGSFECGTRIPDATGVDQYGSVVADSLPGTFHEFDIECRRLPHRFPAELYGAITGVAPGASDVGGRRSVFSEKDGSIRLESVVLFSTQQAMNRFAEMFAFEIPQRHVDGGHRCDRHRRAPEVKCAVVHLLPEPFGLQRIFADDQFPQAAGDVVTERRIDDRFDDFRRRVGFADAFQAGAAAARRTNTIRRFAIRYEGMPLMNAILEMALSNAVVASLMAVVVFGISRVCRRPALIHSLWMLVLVKLVTPPILPVPIEISGIEPPSIYVSPETPVETQLAVVEPVGPKRTIEAESPAVSEEAVARGEAAEPSPVNRAELTLKPTMLTPDGVEKLVLEPRSPAKQRKPKASRKTKRRNRVATIPVVQETADISHLVEPKPGDPIDAVEAPVDAAKSVVADRSASAAGRSEAATPVVADVLLHLHPLVQFVLAVWLIGSVVVGFSYYLRVVWFRNALRLAVKAPAELQAESADLARQLGINRAPTVWLVPGVVAPMLWGGTRRPELLFPRELLGRIDDDARATLMLHELAHLRRGDHWVRYLELFATVLYWWLPVVWWARRQLQIVEEECCDACVVNQFPANGGVYAAALLDTLDFLAESRPAMPPTASGIGRVEFLKRRLTLIMQGTVSGRLTGFARLALVLLAAVALPMWPTLADGRNAEEEPAAAAPKEVPTRIKSERVAPTPAFSGFGEPIDFETASQTLQFDPLEVRSIDVSRDGKWMATGHGRWTTKGAVRLWDWKTRQELASFPAEKGIASVKFSPDGTLLASAGWDFVIEVRDVKTRKVITSINAFNTVSHLAFSPDGKLLASVSEGKEFRLWDPRTGKEVGKFEGETFRMQRVVFSPDGKLIAVGGGNRTNPRNGIVAVYDVKTRKQIQIFKDHTRAVLGLAFSPDSRMLASGGGDNQIRVRRWKSSIARATVQVLSGHNGGIESIAFSPNGRLIASGGYDNTLRLWGAEEGEPLAALPGHSGSILSIGFTPDSKRILSGGSDKAVLVWNPDTRRLSETLQPGSSGVEVPDAILAVAWSPDGKTIASAHEDKTVRLRDASTGNVVRVIDGHDDVVTYLAFSPEGKTIATASSDMMIKLWNVADGALLQTCKGHTNWVFSVVFSPDGKLLASGGYDKTIRIWNRSTGAEVAKLTGHTATVRSVAFSPDGKLIVSGSGDRTLKLWDLAAKKELATLKGHKGSIRAVVFAPDGATFASGSEDKTIKIWDVETRKELRELTGHSDIVWCLAYSPAGKTLASGSYDNSIRLWDPTTGRSRQRLRGHAEVVSSLAFAPDVRGFISGSYDKTLRFWKAKKPPVSELVTLGAAASGTRAVAFAPNGRWLVTAGHESLAKIWDLTTGVVVKVLRGHSGGIRTAAISPDGRTIATGSWDNTIMLWDAATGKLQATLSDGRHSVMKVVFTPDGRKLISGGRDKTAKIWDLESKKLLLTTAPQSLPVTDVSISPDGKTFATSSGDYKQKQLKGDVRLFSVATGKEIGRFEGHTQCVNFVRFNPDGRRLISNGYGGTRLWDVASRKLIRTIGPANACSSVCFLPGGRRVVISRYRGLVMWDTETGKEVLRYTAHNGTTYDVKLSPDASLIATASQDGTVKFWPLKPPKSPQMRQFTGSGPWIGGTAFTPDGRHILTTRGPENSIQKWDIASGQSVQTFSGHTKPTNTLAISPDGRRMLSGGVDATVRLWDLKTGKQLRLLSGHQRSVRTVQFSPDGQRALSGGLDKELRIWDLNTGKTLLQYKTKMLICDAVFTPDGLNVVVPDGSECVVLNVKSGKVVQRFAKHTSQVVCPAISPNGKLVLSGDIDSNLILWDRETGKEVRRFHGHSDKIRSLAFSSDGRRIASGSYDRSIIIWDAATGEQQMKLDGHRAQVLSLKFSADGRQLLSGGGDRTARLWDVSPDAAAANLASRISRWSNLRKVSSFAPLRATATQMKLAYSSSVSRDYKWVAVASQNKTIKLLETATGRVVRTLTGHTKDVWATAFSPDGKTLASVSDDTNIRLWNVQTGSLRTELTSHDTRLVSVLYSPDGKTLFTADRAGNIKLWETATNTEIGNLYREKEALVSLALSPDGKTLAAGGWKKEISLWDVTSRKLITTLAGHKDRILAMAFSPDGRTLVSVSASKDSKEAIQIWDVPTRRLRATPDVTTNHPSAVAFSPDGQSFVVSGADKVLRIFDTHTAMQLKSVPSVHTIDVRSLLWSSDGRRLISTDLNGVVRLWSVGKTGTPWAAGFTTISKDQLAVVYRKTLVKHGAQARFVTFSRDGKQLATGGQDRIARIWDAATMTEKFTLSGHEGIVCFGAFSPDGKTFATGGNDMTVRLWDMTTGKQIHLLEGHTDALRKVLFTPDGKQLISSGDDGMVRIWDVEKGALLRTINSGLHVYSVAISSDGKILATGSANWKTKENRPIAIWDFATGRKLKDLPKSIGKVQSLEFLPDSRTLIAADAGNLGISLWDVDSGQRQRVLHLRADVRLTRLQQGGKLLVSSHGNPGRAGIWNLETGKQVALIELKAYEIYTAEISPDGTTLERNMNTHRWLNVLICGVAIAALTTVARADDRRSAKQKQSAERQKSDDVARVAALIDRLVEAKWKENNVVPAPIADDAEYLRRVTLSIVGRIPRVSDVRAFLNDTSPDKRRKAVAALLEEAGYITNFTTIWRKVMMPEANADFQVRFLIPGFEAWLREKLTSDTPYDEMVRELITTKLDMGRNRTNFYQRIGNASPLAFFQAKQTKPENLASATSRIFLGRRIECAQCHDHPFNSWKRDQFWGFAAFFAGIQRTGNNGIFSQVREIADRRELAIPDSDKVVQATYFDGSEPRWKFRTTARQTLAEWMTAPENPYFAETAVNRIWAHLFGIGIVDPVDDFDNNTPPSHPRLLKELAKEFKQQKFDIKFIIRAIAASKTYQRTSRKTDPSQSNLQLFSRMPLQSMTPEQLANSLNIATGVYQPYQTRSPFTFGRTDARSQLLEVFSNDNDAPTERSTTVLQALAMMNGQIVAGASNPEGSRTLAAVINAPFADTAERVEMLYLATLSRKPTAAESARFVKYVESGGPKKDKSAALGDVFWALLNSSEFLMNH